MKHHARHWTRQAVRLLTLLTAISLPMHGWAWGSLGHQVVANLAEQHLTPQAANQVARLLALEPGATLASIASWADDNREPPTGRWHFVNFPPDDCVYQPARDCPDGNCVVKAIQLQLDTLASAAPPAQKLTALKYLVHFVGDIHQPLHAGRGDDRGGNLYQLNINGQGTNLHAYWDTALPTQVADDAAAWGKLLAAKRAPEQAQITDPVTIAQESCRIVAAPGFYPLHSLGAGYAAAFGSVAEQRLQLAGLRLAGLLNQTFK